MFCVLHGFFMDVLRGRVIREAGAKQPLHVVRGGVSGSREILQQN